MKIFRYILVLLLVCGMGTAGRAQTMLEGEVPSYIHRFAPPGRATMTIYVWGQVGTPGIWKVEKGINLVELLSAAGVGGIGIEGTQTRQSVVLHLYREQQGQRVQVYRRQLEEIMAEGAEPPILEENDVLMIETEQREKLTFRTVVQYVGSISSVVLLILRLTTWR